MNPNPLSALNHFTVPVDIHDLLRRHPSRVAYTHRDSLTDANTPTLLSSAGPGSSSAYGVYKRRLNHVGHHQQGSSHDRASPADARGTRPPGGERAHEPGRSPSGRGTSGA